MDVVGDTQSRKRIEVVGDPNDLSPDQPGNDAEARQDRNGQSSKDDRNDPGAAQQVGLRILHTLVLAHRPQTLSHSKIDQML